jgi:hypothetical protein
MCSAKNRTGKTKNMLRCNFNGEKIYSVHSESRLEANQQIILRQIFL